MLDWPEAECEVLYTQVAVNKSAAVANEAMQSQLGNLQRELAAAQAAASAAVESQQRAQAAEKAAADSRLEAQNALAAAAAMEERVQAAEEEMDSVAGMLPPTLLLFHKQLRQLARICVRSYSCEHAAALHVSSHAPACHPCTNCKLASEVPSCLLSEQ